MTDRPKKLTIYDIARLSGMSVSTISRVLNNSPNVSAKTKAHVTDIIEKYHFSPSSVARAMMNNHTQTLGVIVSDIPLSFATLFTVDLPMVFPTPYRKTPISR